MEKRAYHSPKHKSKLVLELLRGADIEELSCREKITVADLHSWSAEFIKDYRS